MKVDESRTENPKGRCGVRKSWGYLYIWGTFTPPLCDQLKNTGVHRVLRPRAVRAKNKMKNKISITSKKKKKLLRTYVRILILYFKFFFPILSRSPTKKKKRRKKGEKKEKKIRRSVSCKALPCTTAPHPKWYTRQAGRAHCIGLKTHIHCGVYISYSRALEL